MSQDSSNSSFGLSRWARLKEEKQAKERELAQSQELARSHEAAEELDETALLSAEEYCDQLPEIESLDAESDFSVFMDERVIPELRKRALRALFKQPHFNIRDGLDDYDDDYTFFEPLGDIETSDMKYAKAQQLLREEEQEKIAEGVNDEIFDEDANEAANVDSEVEEIENVNVEDEEAQSVDNQSPNLEASDDEQVKRGE